MLLPLFCDVCKKVRGNTNNSTEISHGSYPSTNCKQKSLFSQLHATKTSKSCSCYKGIEANTLREQYTTLAIELEHSKQHACDLKMCLAASKYTVESLFELKTQLQLNTKMMTELQARFEQNLHGEQKYKALKAQLALIEKNQFPKLQEKLSESEEEIESFARAGIEAELSAENTSELTKSVSKSAVAFETVLKKNSQANISAVETSELPKILSEDKAIVENFLNQSAQAKLSEKETCDLQKSLSKSAKTFETFVETILQAKISTKATSDLQNSMAERVEFSETIAKESGQAEAITKGTSELQKSTSKGAKFFLNFIKACAQAELSAEDTSKHIKILSETEIEAAVHPKIACELSQSKQKTTQTVECLETANAQQEQCFKTLSEPNESSDKVNGSVELILQHNLTCDLDSALHEYQTSQANAYNTQLNALQKELHESDQALACSETVNAQQEQCLMTLSERNESSEEVKLQHYLTCDLDSASNTHASNTQLSALQKELHESVQTIACLQEANSQLKLNAQKALELQSQQEETENTLQCMQDLKTQLQTIQQNSRELQKRLDEQESTHIRLKELEAELAASNQNLLAKEVQTVQQATEISTKNQIIADLEKALSDKTLELAQQLRTSNALSAEHVKLQQHFIAANLPEAVQNKFKQFPRAKARGLAAFNVEIKNNESKQSRDDEDNDDDDYEKIELRAPDDA